MNIIEKEALKLDSSRGFYKNRRRLESLKSNLIDKFFNFNRDRNKLDFLEILREKQLKIKKHMLSLVMAVIMRQLETSLYLLLTKK